MEARDSDKMATFVKGLQNVFVDGEYSDLIIECKDRSWRAHKLVVCTQCDFFRKACDGAFREAQENKITLTSDDPDIVDVLLHSLYHFDYPDEAVSGVAPLLTNLRVFQIADKYQLEHLQKLSVEKFNKRAHEDWATDSFAETVQEIFGSDDESKGSVETLELIVLEVVKEHAKELFHDAEYATFQQAAVNTPGFLFQFARSSTADLSSASILVRAGQITWYKCPGQWCQKHGAIFGIRSHPLPKFGFSCPLKCSPDRAQAWWSSYKVSLI